MLDRAGQIVAGIFCDVIGAFILLGPILRFDEQPSVAGYITGGAFVAFGMWLKVPVGMGKFGDYVSRKIPFLHHHEEDEA